MDRVVILEETPGEVMELTKALAESFTKHF
jgi:hypothetical protein